jgi:hypothetical protein
MKDLDTRSLLVVSKSLYDHSVKFGEMLSTKRAKVLDREINILFDILSKNVGITSEYNTEAYKVFYNYLNGCVSTIDTINTLNKFANYEIQTTIQKNKKRWLKWIE